VRASNKKEEGVIIVKMEGEGGGNESGSTGDCLRKGEPGERIEDREAGYPSRLIYVTLRKRNRSFRYVDGPIISVSRGRFLHFGTFVPTTLSEEMRRF